MHKRLPVHVGKSAVAVAAVEVRVSHSAAGPMHALLPGYLMAKYPNEAIRTKRLPIAGIPEEVRRSTPELLDQPLTSITWRGHEILVGRRRVSLSAKPYPGWSAFKDAAVNLFGQLIASSAVELVEGISIKYINFFPEPEGQVGIMDVMDWQIRLGDLTIDRSTQISLRMERKVDDVATIVKAVVPAFLHGEAGERRRGGVLDVDCVQTFAKPLEKIHFEPQLDTALESIHKCAKQAVFDSLSDATIQSMEPVYGD